MKKIMTVLLAASLSGAMLVGMAACNNQGGSGEQSGVLNPFASNSAADTQSTVESQVTSDTSTANSTDSQSSADTEISAVQNSEEESTTFVEPTESSVVSTVSSIDISEPVSASSVPNSDVPEISFDESDDPWIDDSDPYEYSTVTPKGTVNPAYAGTYTIKTDYTNDELRAMYSDSYGMSSDEVTDEMLDYIRQTLTMMTMTITLNADGGASASVSAMGESSEATGGSWLADGTTIYITIEGSTAEFTYNNGTLTSPDLDGMIFIKS